jgi:3-hydroxy-9,10-secoandrosta-1,3,5(10)-triene-9,17-dione monooxygenase reductase component
MTSAAISPDELRRVLGRYPTGVAVLTANDVDRRIGMAANSVTSVSLDPPLILVCPARSSTTWPRIRARGRFCVNVMAGHHEEACRRFAAKEIDRFEGLAVHDREAGPGLDDAIAWIDCAIETEHDAGDHTIVVARIVAIEAAGDGEPLVFFRGSYGSFTSPA